jgi:hypothetical protein
VTAMKHAEAAGADWLTHAAFQGKSGGLPRGRVSGLGGGCVVARVQECGSRGAPGAMVFGSLSALASCTGHYPQGRGIPDGPTHGGCHRNSLSAGQTATGVVRGFAVETLRASYIPTGPRPDPRK